VAPVAAPLLTSIELLTGFSGRKKYHGGMSAEDDEEKTICLKNERDWGAFYREIPVPRGIEEGQVKAEMDNGLLKIIVPKAGKREPTCVSSCCYDRADEGLSCCGCRLRVAHSQRLLIPVGPGSVELLSRAERIASSAAGV
jgi:hypothetical protein